MNYISIENIKNGVYSFSSISPLRHFELQTELEKENIFVDLNGSSKTFLSVNTDKVTEILKDKISDNSKIFYGCLLSQHNFHQFIDKIYQITDSLNFAHEKVYFYTCSIDAVELYNQWLEFRPDVKKIQIIQISAWEFYTKFNSKLQTNPSYQIGLKEKKFLCFNRRVKPHKLALILFLSKHNLLDKCYISFFMEDHSDSLSGHTKQELFSWLNSQFRYDQLMSDLINEYDVLKDNLPLKLNINNTYAKRYVDDDDLEYFSNSYFSLVTENIFFADLEFNGQQQRFLSENTFKPIVMKHPFMLLASVRSLAYLKKLGYRTFNGLIDESYDTIENDTDRFLAVTNEIQRLCYQTDNEWLSWQQEILPIVEYNYQLLYEKNQDNFIIEKFYS